MKCDIGFVPTLHT